VGDRKNLPQHGLPESTGELMPAEITERNLRGRIIRGPSLGMESEILSGQTGR
jgi:hypothetical protein